jgi:hypothetical protein
MVEFVRRWSMLDVFVAGGKSDEDEHNFIGRRATGLIRWMAMVGD